MTAALSGLRVVDVTQVMAGPFCSQILGDLGADVVKVEPVGVGDASRRSMGSASHGGESSAFLAVNRNKRSVAIDLKQAEGRAAFYRIAEGADVMVENFRPGVTARLGIDFAEMSGRNPRLVYASVSGFGQTGPYASRPGYDLIAQAMSGVMSVTGTPDGPPVKCGIPVADLSAGMFAAIGILAALTARGHTGRGQHVDVSLYDAALALSVWETAELWATGVAPKPMGSAHRLNAPYQVFRTADGFAAIGANNDRLWRQLCAALGRLELADDTRFRTNPERLANKESLVQLLEETLTRRPTAEWLSVLVDAGVPAGPVLDYAEACADPHTLAREMVVQVEHPTAGPVRVLGTPVKLSGTPGTIRRPAPLLGEHTDEVLREAGYSDADVALLRETGAVG